MEMKLSKTVDIKRLKAFAAEKLPQSMVVKDVILAERDSLETMEFVRKLRIWLRLLAR